VEDEDTALPNELLKLEVNVTAEKPPIASPEYHEGE